MDANAAKTCKKYINSSAKGFESSLVPIENAILANLTREEWAGWQVGCGFNGRAGSQEGRRGRAEESRGSR